jgi:hypothetical protein
MPIVGRHAGLLLRHGISVVFGVSMHPHGAWAMVGNDMVSRPERGAAAAAGEGNAEVCAARRVLLYNMPAVDPSQPSTTYRSGRIQPCAGESGVVVSFPMI